MPKNIDFKLGGEFDINPQALNGFSSFNSKEHEFLFSSGRSALMAILRFVAKTKPSIIYIPYYICSSVVTACKNAGFQVVFYELNKNFLFPIETLNKIERDATILSVNYFGFINDNSLQIEIKKKRPDITTISDHVQSFWTYKKSLADFSFTSLRKHIPTPDGALVYSNNANWNIDSKIEENTFHSSKLIGAILKNNKVDDRVYLKYFESGEEILDKSISITKASELSHYLFKITDWDQIKQRRKENYKFIYDMGRKNGLVFLFPFNEDVIPLCVPILIINRDEVRKKLMTKNIFLPIHWPLMDFNKDSEFTKELIKNELSIIVDQRYSIKEMKYQMNCLISKF